MLFALNKKIRSTISLRIAFLFCATFAVGLAVAFLVTYFELRYSLEKSSHEILMAKMQEAKVLLSTEGIPGLRQFLSEEKNRILNAPYLVRVVTPDGETLYIKPSIEEKNFDFDAAFNRKIRPADYIGWRSLPAIDDEDKFNLLTEKTDQNLYLQVGKSSEEREEILEEILMNFAVIEIVLVFLGALFGSWYARKSLAPLRGLLSTIRMIEKGNLSGRVPASSTNDELQEIGDTFNRMIARIENLIKIMGESLDNVAHDIRTPLTRIRSVAEHALLSNDTALLRESLEDTAESSMQIAELVDQLLSISETEAGVLQLHLENCDIKSLVMDVVDIYEFPALEKLIKIDFSSISSDLKWTIDRKRIKQVIANLIDNAIKFSPAQSEILISAIVDKENLLINISDQGCGITEADRIRIWDRLFRSDKSRSTKGLGLGLAIVRAVVLAHRGRCEITALSVGTQFSVILPNS